MDFSTLENRVLAGRFRLIREIGRGGFGSVFEAEQISVARRCALKLLSLENSGSIRETAARFEQEARATSRLTHPNTVTIFDFGRDEETGLLFLAMELLEGESLHVRIKSQTFDVKTCARVIAQIAGSLSEAHRVGLVHRDIKPHNIMLVPREDEPLFVKVIDFGIAKALQDDISARDEQITKSGTIIGTPSYMSPEQIEQEPLDGRSDQYALACLVYTMLSGKPPFHVGSAMGIATRHLRETPPALSSRVEVSPKLDRILLRALSKQPADRFSDVRGFSNAFSEAAGIATTFTEIAEPVPRRVPTAVEATSTMTKNQTKILYAGVLFVLIGIASITAVLIAKNSAENLEPVAKETQMNEPIIQEERVASEPTVEESILEPTPIPNEPEPVVEETAAPIVAKEERRKKRKEPVAETKKEPTTVVEKETVKESSAEASEKKADTKPNVMWGME